MSAERQPSRSRRLYRRPRVRRIFRALASPSKFGLVGIIGIAVNQAALYVFTDVLGIYYLWSAVLASQVSTLNNFLLTEYWVFGDRELGGSRLWRYLAFNAINAATLLIRIPVLYVLTDIFGVFYLWSNLVAIAATFGVRYLVADNWIWAGRDRRDQRAIEGNYQYDIQGLIRIQSPVALPELASFNVDHVVEPDLLIRRRLIGGGPRLSAGTTKRDGIIKYREQLGILSTAFDVTIPEERGKPIILDANWLLVWSHHVLYTNMVEPLLRFMFVDREHVLLHCAAIDAPDGAIVMSALTDTGKTSTVLRLLMHHSWGFLSDDMAIVSPEGELLAYPKPMTLSSHTMSAVNERALPTADRLMLAIRSRLHSREGRAVGHALGRMPIPIVTVNAWVQILIPPPKYHVTSLIDCDMADRSTIDSIILLERGEPFAELPTLEATVDRLLTNTDDAYTFPPFSSFSKLIAIGGRDYEALRVRERELLTASVERAWRVRVRVRGHNWSDLIPTLVREKRPLLEADVAADDAEERTDSLSAPEAAVPVEATPEPVAVASASDVEAAAR